MGSELPDPLEESGPGTLLSMVPGFGGGGTKERFESFYGLPARKVQTNGKELQEGRAEKVNTAG